MENIIMDFVSSIMIVGMICLIMGLVSFGILIAIIAKRDEWLGAMAGGLLALGICLLIASLPISIMEMWVRLFSSN